MKAKIEVKNKAGDKLRPQKCLQKLEPTLEKSFEARCVASARQM